MSRKRRTKGKLPVAPPRVLHHSPNPPNRERVAWARRSLSVLAVAGIALSVTLLWPRIVLSLKQSEATTELLDIVRYAASACLALGGAIALVIQFRHPATQ